MKTPPIFLLQTAIYDRLTSVLSTPVYDIPPQGSAFPYITLGQPTVRDISPTGYQMWHCTRTLHAWSRQSGQKETADMLTAICSALTDGALTITGWHCLQVWTEMIDISEDPDFKSIHGVIRLRFTLQTS